MDLKQLIDEGVAAPPPAPVDAYVARGRRAVRRRRLAACAGGTAVVLAVAGASLAVGGPDPAREPSTASEAAVATSTPADVSPGTAQVPPLPDAAAGIDPGSGVLEMANGWRVVERIDDPITAPVTGEEGLPESSLALSLRKGDDTQWLLLFWYPGGSGMSGNALTLDPGGFTSFGAWVDYRVAVATGGPTDELVTMAEDGTLSPLGGVRLDAQRRTPELDTPGTTTSVGQVQVSLDRWYVLAVRSAAGTAYYPVAYPSEGQPDTVDGFVEHVAPEVAAGRYP